VQKQREEAAEKEWDEHFNTIQPVILMKQEWRVKEMTSAPTLMTFDDDMDLLDDDKSSLIKDESPPLTSMDINIVFMLSVEFRGAEEEVAQMCLKPKEVMFENHLSVVVPHHGSHGRPMRGYALLDPLGAQVVRRPGLLLGCHGEDVLGKFSR
jgi:hypothetical protein